MAIKDPATRDQIRKIYDTNWKLIESLFPGALEELAAAPDPIDRIELTGKNELNLRVDGQRLYPPGVQGYIRKQTQEFMRRPSAVERVPSGVDPREGLSQDFQRKILHHSPIVIDSEIRHRSYKIERDYVPLMIVFGVGSGLHIEELLSNYDIQNLVIVEKDWEIMKASLYMANWGRIIRNLISTNRTINLVAGPSVEVAAGQIISATRRNNPVFVSNALLYNHYSSQFFDNVRSVLEEKLELVMQGWGFFEDECATLQQTLINESRSLPLLQADPEAPEGGQPVPAFIAAAGPSLDEGIEYIRANRERAVLISCGTALGPIYRAGLKPDFHVEMERGDVVRKALERDVPRSFMAEIPFVGPTRLHPSSFDYTDIPLMYIKDMDAGGDLYPQDWVRLTKENPTVSNTALSWAALFGFREIYLFGTDMGARSPERHHSRDTVYYQEESGFQGKESAFKKVVSANFGGEVVTTPVLFWSKSNLEGKLREFPDMVCYNTSDGAFIEGTKPLSLVENGQDLPAPKIGKEEVVRWAREQFRVGCEPRISPERLPELITHLRETVAGIQRRIGGPIGARWEIIPRFAALNVYMEREVKERDYAVFMALRGSLLEFQMLLYTHAFSADDHEEAVQFLNVGLGLFREFVEQAGNEYEALAWEGIARLEAVRRTG